MESLPMTADELDAKPLVYASTIKGSQKERETHCGEQEGEAESKCQTHRQGWRRRERDREGRLPRERLRTIQ